MQEQQQEQEQEERTAKRRKRSSFEEYKSKRKSSESSKEGEVKLFVHHLLWVPDHHHEGLLGDALTDEKVDGIRNGEEKV